MRTDTTYTCGHNITSENADNGTSIHLVLDELHDVTGLISKFLEEVVPSFDETKRPLFPESTVRKVLIKDYASDWIRLGDREYADNRTFLSAEEVIDVVRTTPMSLRIERAFTEWFTQYYLPRIRDIPKIYAAIPDSAREIIRALSKANGDKCAVMDAIKAKLFGRANVIDIVAGHTAAINNIFDTLISQDDYFDCEDVPF